jgi:hypothetical protein
MVKLLRERSNRSRTSRATSSAHAVPGKNTGIAAAHSNNQFGANVCSWHKSEVT